MSAMVPKFKFTEGEKVLCFHGPLLYEAKCIKAQVKDKQVKYFIHYSGWNKNWDEWVPESRVLKFSDANLQKQKELQKAHIKTKKTKVTKVVVKKEPAEKERASTPSQDKPKQKASTSTTSASTSSSSSTSSVVKVEASNNNSNSSNEASRKKRTRAEQNVESEDEFVQKMEIKVRIPDELKIWLVDDWDLITKHKKLVHLPARITVEHILKEYVKQKIAEKAMTLNKTIAIAEVTKGVREYFNIMLGKQLLYKFERPQYQEVLSVHADKQMSEIYGAIHLLRLFATIGSLLAYTLLNDETITLVLNHFQDFIKFMSKPSQNFLALSDYEVASTEYCRKAV